MYYEGHIGAAIAVYAPILAGVDSVTLSVGGALWIVAWGLAPDLDSIRPFEKYVSHRGPTHSIGFVALAAIVGALAGAPFGNPLYFSVLAALGVYSHLAVDVLNRMGVAILWPLCGRRYALGVCYAGDEEANNLLVAAALVLTAISILANSFPIP